MVEVDGAGIARTAKALGGEGTNVLLLKSDSGHDLEWLDAALPAQRPHFLNELFRRVPDPAPSKHAMWPSDGSAGVGAEWLEAIMGNERSGGPEVYQLLGPLRRMSGPRKDVSAQ